MRRYSNINSQIRYDGKRVYKSIIYPIIPLSVTDIQIISNEGDYLDTLAYRYYGDPTLYFIIALANPGVGKGRFSIPSGTILRIPININSIISDFDNLNK